MKTFTKKITKDLDLKLNIKDSDRLNQTLIWILKKYPDVKLSYSSEGDKSAMTLFESKLANTVKLSGIKLKRNL